MHLLVWSFDDSCDKWSRFLRTTKLQTRHAQPTLARESPPGPTYSGTTPPKKTIHLLEAEPSIRLPTRPRPVRSRRHGHAARPTTNAKATNRHGSDRTTSTTTPRPSPTTHRRTHSQPRGARRKRSAPAGRSSRTEMRGGSRPTPAALFLIAAAGICAQFATGSRSRSAC